jgi:hypothetical protein
MTNCENAVALLNAASVPAEVTDYGFRVRLPDAPARAFADCGMDNDSSISMSIDTDEMPPAIWFFRRDYLEMAEFLVASFSAAGGETASRAELVAAMRQIDQDYDDTDLIKMTEAFLGEIEDEA